MRIGLFTDTYPPFINGVSTSVYMLKNSLERMGHEVYVVTLNDKGFRYKFDDDKKVVRIPGLPIGLYDYRVTTVYPLRAINIIRKWKLDVIHSHTEFSIGTFARFVSRQFNIPLVHTYHTLYEDYVYYITKGHFDKPSKKVVEYLTKFYCDKTADELIVPTKKIADLFTEKYEFDKTLNIIPTGIEIERFYSENVDPKKVQAVRDSLKLSKDSFNIIFVGRMAKEKSLEVLIEAHKKICEQEKNINLLFIGDGPEINEYKDLVKKLKITKNVIFTGKIPWEEVPAYYQVCDLFASASTSETQGVTVIEAMAAEAAPICINDQSFTTTVTDGVNGRIFKTQDEYADIVLELYKDRKQLAKLQKQARIDAEKHSAKYYGESVYEVYKRAVKNKDYDNYGVIGKIVEKIKEGKNETRSRKSKNVSK